jgi:hypothetical protein
MSGTQLQDHADAVLALLRAEDRLIVYPAEDGGPTVIPNGAQPPYLTVHFNAERTLSGRLNHRSTRFLMRIYLSCTGKDDVGARAVCDLAAGVLLDVKPDIPGRNCYPIRHEHHRPQTPQEDQSTGSLYATIVDLYRLESMTGTTGS